MDQKEQLRREIGVFGLAAGVTNFIIGAGIYVLPALVAVILGGSSVLAYVICGGLLLMIMFCFAEIGSQVKVSGGPYAYIQAAFGPYIGFLSNVLFWFGYCVIADAAIANAMADMLALKVPILGEPVFRGVFFAIVFSIFAVINIRGVKHGLTLVKTLTLIKLTPLVLLVLIGAFSIQGDNLAFGPWPSTLSLGEASLLLFFAFGGGEGALSTSGEISNPSRTVPRGLLLGVGSVIVFYICIQLVTQGVLGSDLVHHEEAPLAEVARAVVGNAGAGLMVIAAAVSIFGTLSGSIMQYPRILYAGSLHGSAPSFLSRVHSRFATPVWAIVTYAVLDFGFAISGGFKQLAVISSAALLLTYLGVVLATIKFKLKRPVSNQGAFRIPGGLTIPVLAIVAISWFLFQLSGRELLFAGAFLVLLTLIYLAVHLNGKRMS